jgi:hypothetical protein
MGSGEPGAGQFTTPAPHTGNSWSSSGSAGSVLDQSRALTEAAGTMCRLAARNEFLEKRIRALAMPAVLTGLAGRSLALIASVVIVLAPALPVGQPPLDSTAFISEVKLRLLGVEGDVGGGGVHAGAGGNGGDPEQVRVCVGEGREAGGGAEGGGGGGGGGRACGRRLVCWLAG